MVPGSASCYWSSPLPDRGLPQSHQALPHSSQTGAALPKPMGPSASCKILFLFSPDWWQRACCSCHPALPWAAWHTGKQVIKDINIPQSCLGKSIMTFIVKQITFKSHLYIFFEDSPLTGMYLWRQSRSWWLLCQISNCWTALSVTNLVNKESFNWELRLYLESMCHEFCYHSQRYFKISYLYAECSLKSISFQYPDVAIQWSFTDTS